MGALPHAQLCFAVTYSTVRYSSVAMRLELLEVEPVEQPRELLLRQPRDRRSVSCPSAT